jgi:hypothetical protein
LLELRLDVVDEPAAECQVDAAGVVTVVESADTVGHELCEPLRVDAFGATSRR